MARNFAVVTSFNAKHWDDPITRECVRGLAQWPCEAHVFVDGGMCGVSEYLVNAHDFDEDILLRGFKDRYAPLMPRLVYPEHVYEYRLDVVRFAHKPFALRRVLDYTVAETIIWVDADVVTTDQITLGWLEKMIPEECVASYLGRKDWGHSECGFLGINDREFLWAFRDEYLTNQVFGYPEWHDSYVFDCLRKRWGGGFHNLSEGIKGKHVFPKSALSECLSHYKGPARKRHGKDFTDEELEAVTEQEGMRVVA